MVSATSARRYAQAALELGIEHGDLDAWRNDLARLAGIWDDPATRAYLEDVRVGKQARLDRCREALGTLVAPRVLNMVLLLTSRGRTSLMPYIARYFTELERERENTVVARVTSAQPLSADEQKELGRRIAEYTGKSVQLEAEVQPAILGGLIIQVGDQLLDMSVAGKLSNMRDQVVGRRAS